MGLFEDVYYFAKWFAPGGAGVPPHYRLGPCNLQDENYSCLTPQRLRGHSSREIPFPPHPSLEVPFWEVGDGPESIPVGSRAIRNLADRR